MNQLFIHHYIHLYFLTEFEIFFYIFYIMPYEKKLIFDLIKLDDIPRFNISYSYSDNKCPEYQNRLDQSNIKLWDMCIYYLIAINAFLFLIFCKDLLKNYTQFSEMPTSPKSYNSGSSLMAFGSANNLSLSDYKKNDDTGIELRPLSKNVVISEEQRETYFIVYYWKKSVFVAEFCKTTQFIILVGVFEYLFFKSVINKYKVVDTKTLLCNLSKELLNN
jgi:hypothetical protein